MVSIDIGTIPSGAVSFNDIKMDSDSTELLHHTLNGETSNQQFRKLKTPMILLFLMIICISFEVAVFLLSALDVKLIDGKLDYFSIILLSHVGLWTIFLIAQRYIRYEHHVTRTRGYLEFYTKTKEMKTVPLAVLSIGNVLLLMFVVLWESLLTSECRESLEDYCKRPKQKRDLILYVLVSLEFLALMISIVMHLVAACRFNRDALMPDVIQEDCNSAVMSGSMEVGYRDETMCEELVEKQAEMIRYLKEHNAQLGKRVLQLTETMSTHT